MEVIRHEGKVVDKDMEIMKDAEMMVEMEQTICYMLTYMKASLLRQTTSWSLVRRGTGRPRGSTRTPWGNYTT